ncbi:marine proteobacterial sortase target protein [Aliikangiella sp. IMCC44359]|uniref:marine proteobacterial sortase target protein n=1 Tax=Aliikangiella sp. IMCC44359 TaxID=3459125 RepID=UPI00403AB14D
MKIKKLSVVFLIPVLILLTATGLGASQYEEDDLTQGILNLKSQSGVENQALALETKVTMNIAGLTARVELTQVFVNNSNDWVEGMYLFPLPENSAVDHLKVKVGQRTIIGEIKEKQEAKKIYQQAKISGKKASLVEQFRPNVFSNSVANIAPGEVVEVTIEYQQDLIYQKEAGLSIRFPMTMTQRYSPSSVLVENYYDFEHGIQTAPTLKTLIDLPQEEQNQSKNAVSIHINLHSGVPVESITSPSHDIDYSQVSESMYQIDLRNNKYKADRDFILSWKPLQGQEPRAALFSEKIGHESFISLMVMPPSSAVTNINLQRELIFVLDTSGSMSGESIQQAKEALIFGLSTLTVGDKFNIIEFNSVTSQLYQQAQPFDKNSHQEAIDFVKQLSANGGTEMLAALKASLNGEHDKNRVRQVIFLTDGAINNEAELFNEIEKSLGDSRLFTVGIGSAPNEFFMKRAALFGRGTFTFIANISQSKRKMKKLFNQISRPVLSHINITWPKNIDIEMYPQKIPDLLADEPLWIKSKVSELYGDIEIVGRLSNSEWRTRIPLSMAKDIDRNQARISRLWAREKVTSIMNKNRHRKLNAKDKADVIEVALKHHLITQFTSLVATEKKSSRNHETFKTHKVRQVKPKGNRVLHYPKTALNLWFNPALSFFILLIGLFYLFSSKRLIEK